MLAECLERCNSTVRLLGATYDIDAVPRAERLRDALRVLRRYAGKDNGRRKVPGSRRGLDFTVNVVRGKLQHEPGEAKEQLGRRNEVFDLDEGQAPIAGNIAVALPALLIIEKPSRAVPRDPITTSKPFSCHGRRLLNSSMGVD